LEHDMSGPSGTWTTTSGGAGVKVTAGGVLALAAVALVATHRHQAGEAVSGAAITAVCIVASVVIGAVVFAVVRLRGHRTADETAGVSSALELRPTWKANPNAIPAAEPKAITSPLIVANTYNFYGDAGTAQAARLMAAQVIPGTAQEVQR
jgi:heme/copper-type cytochrome/quinol oxidase subunit 2